MLCDVTRASERLVVIIGVANLHIAIMYSFTVSGSQPGELVSSTE